MSERVNDPKFNKPKALLEAVKGMEFVEFDRYEECCGFGGTFAVTEEAVPAKIGYGKLTRLSSPNFRAGYSEANVSWC